MKTKLSESSGSHGWAPEWPERTIITAPPIASAMPARTRIAFIAEVPTGYVFPCAGLPSNVWNVGASPRSADRSGARRDIGDRSG